MPATQQGAVRTGGHRVGWINSAVEGHEQLRAGAAKKVMGLWDKTKMRRRLLRGRTILPRVVSVD
jgi:hypothetical protein